MGTDVPSRESECGVIMKQTLQTCNYCEPYESLHKFRPQTIHDLSIAFTDM
jgi:hypothetical protein